MIRRVFFSLLTILISTAMADFTPLWVKTLGANTYSSPLVADVNNDRQLEIVIGTSNGEVRVFSGKNDLDPLMILTTGKQITATPACGLLGSTPAIVCGSYDGFIYAWNGTTGAEMWKVDTGKPIRSSAAIGDINGDGNNDVVVGSDNGKLYALDGSGHDLNGFPFTLNRDKTAAIASSPALADVDNDGKLEIAVGADDGKIYLIKVTADGPTLMSGYPVSTEYMVRSSPIFADIDGDGRYEIVVGSDDFSIYAFKMDGKYPSVITEEMDPVTKRKIKKRVSKWPIKTEYKIQFSSPAAADVDGDKRPEAFIGSGDGFLYGLKGDGLPLPGFPAQCGGKLYYSSPVIADVSGDGIPDIVIASSDGGVYAYDSKGAAVPSFPIVTGANNSINVTPAVADVNNDGYLEVVFADSSRNLYAYKTNSNKVSSIYNPWNQFHQNQWHSGAFGVISGGVVELPSCKIESPKDRVRGDISINYQLTDKSNSLIDLEAQFSTDWGREWKPATVIGKTTSIGPSAYKGAIIWDSRKDLMGPMEAGGETDANKLAEERRTYRERASIVFKIIPSNVNGMGNAGETANIWVDNNVSPIAKLDNPMDQEEYQAKGDAPKKDPSGDIKIFYHFADEEQDTLGYIHEPTAESPEKVNPEFSLDGGKTWKDAKHISGLSSGIRPSKYNSYLVWESDREEEMVGVDSYDIVFRITPYDISNVNENVIDVGTPGITPPFHVDNNEPPRVLLTDLVEDEYKDNVTIHYELFDREDDPVSLKIYFSTDGGTTWSQKEASCETKGLLIPKINFDKDHRAEGTFIWHSKQDLAGIDSRMIQIKAVPTDNDAGKTDTTGNFHVDNNLPPSTVIAKVDGEQKDDVTINYSLSDPENDTLSILCEYSTKGKDGPWRPATVTGSTSEISRDKYNQSIIWNTNVDLMGLDQKDILFRITASDNDPGEPGLSNPMWIDDNAPPNVLLADITEDQKWDVTLSYTLSDIEQDTLSIKVEYSTDSGTSWKPATVKGETKDLVPDKYIGDIIWESKTDLPNKDIDTVQARITPSDNDAGTPSATANFRVDNNEPPTIALETPTTIQKGDVAITYHIKDAESDPVDLVSEFSEDNGDNWVLATCKGDNKGITASGYNGKVIWDSTTDAFGVDKDTVQFRVIPKDKKEGPAVATGSFRLDNNQPPSIVLNPFPTGTDGKVATQKGEIEIPYVITDAENDPVTLKCEFSEDGGRTWEPAQLEGIIQDIDSSGYIGSVIWRSDVPGNLPSAYLADVMFRITPSDKDVGKPSDTGKFPIDNNVPPIVRLTTPTGKLTTDVIIPYELEDPEKDVTELICEFSTDDGLTWNNKPSMPTGITAIDPKRYAGNITWYSGNDLKGVDLTTVRFRVTPYDHRAGLSDTTGSFHVDNNTLPKVTISDLGSNWISGDVSIPYRIEDAENNAVTLQCQYSTDNGSTWKDATMMGNTINLESGQYTSSIVWNSQTDLPGIRSDKVLFRMLPTDNDQGTAFVTKAFSLDNNRPPTVSLNNIFEESKGDVSIEYVIADDEDDTVSIACEFSPDNGQTWKPATVTGTTTGIAKSGYQGTITWNSAKDLLGVDSTQVLFRVTPTDYKKGTPGITAPIHVNNNRPPAITLNTPTGFGTGEVKISYTISDPENDDVDLVVEYSTDGGTTWDTAHTSGDYKEIKSGKYSGSFAWLSGQDTAGLYSDSVLLRITPKDASGTGVAVTTGKVGINNNLPPTIAFSLPKERLSGDVPVDLNISDPENDNVNLKIEVSGDNGSTWKPATITSGITSDISNLNFASTIFWNTARDFPGLYSDKVAMRITPTDVNKNEGKPTVVSGIQVNNNEPPKVTITMGTPAANGDVPVSYRISDAENDSNISLAPEYSPDGGFSWFPATTEGNLTNIGPSGYSGSLTWKSSKDAPGKNLDAVQFRITGSDYNRGEATTSQKFVVKNNEPPTITLGTPSGTSGDICIPFTIKDREGDKVSLVCDYSMDGGRTWAPAYILGITTEIDPKGYEGSITWASATDFANKTGSMMLRVTPRDIENGAPATVTIGVDNNKPPEISLTDPMGEAGGIVKINFYISDAESDPVDLLVEYTTDGGSTWKKATIVGNTVGIRDYNSSFDWDSAKDLGKGGKTRVQLRATPSEPGRKGNPAVTNPFDVSNITPPTITITSAGEPDKTTGDITIGYSITDPDNAMVDIVTEYSDDGGRNWYPTTIVGTKTGIAPSAYAGKLTWKFRTDVPTQIPNASFRFRIVAANKGVAGNPSERDIVVPVTGSGGQ